MTSSTSATTPPVGGAPGVASDERERDGALAAGKRQFGPRHRWLVLGIGVAAQASFSAAISGIPVTGPTMRSSYHLSNTGLGFVLGAIYLGIAVSEILWGVWTDKFGERRILLLGLASTAAVLALSAAFIVPSGSYVPSTAVLAVVMFALGVFGGSINGSSGRAVMAWFQDGQRGFAMSVRQTAMPAGGAIGIAVLPWLASTYGFRPVYALVAVLCLLSAGVAWVWLHEPDLSTIPGAKGGAVGVSPLRRWDIWRLALASGLLTVPQFGVLTFAAVFLHDVHHASTIVTVATLLVVQIGGGTARIWSGRFSDRHRNRRQMIKIFGLAAGVLMLGAAALTHQPTWIVAGMLALGGLCANAWHGVAYTEIAAMAGVSRAGTALGLENTTVFATGFLTPLLIPILLHGTSWGLVWTLVGAASVLAVVLAPGSFRSAAKGSQKA
jgi:sugar phosphate permease